MINRLNGISQQLLLESHRLSTILDNSVASTGLPDGNSSIDDGENK